MGAVADGPRHSDAEELRVVPRMAQSLVMHTPATLPHSFHRQASTPLPTTSEEEATSH